MFMTDIITLIGTTETVDAYGDMVMTETQRNVFCSVASIGQKEFYEAQAVGLKPEIKFILQDYIEYNGELLLTYGSTRYHVLRTYRTGNRLELVCYTEVNPSVAPAQEPESADAGETD